jgi:hypothetical protein
MPIMVAGDVAVRGLFANPPARYVGKGSTGVDQSLPGILPSCNSKTRKRGGWKEETRRRRGRRGRRGKEGSLLCLGGPLAQGLPRLRDQPASSQWRAPRPAPLLALAQKAPRTRDALISSRHNHPRCRMGPPSSLLQLSAPCSLRILSTLYLALLPWILVDKIWNSLCL